MVSWLLCLTLIVSLLGNIGFIKEVHAEGEEEGYSVIRDSEYSEFIGDIGNYVAMKNGAIEFLVYAKKATNSIRYGTLGYTVTLEPLSTKTAVNSMNGKTYTGVEDVSSKRKGVIRYDQGEKKNAGEKDYKGDTYEGTKYNFTSQAVADSIKNQLDLEDIKEPTMLYLHAFFYVYRVDSSGKEVVIASNIYDWDDIFDHQSWANPQDFVAFYNIPLQFSPGMQPNEIVQELELLKGGTKTYSEDTLDYKYINERVSWSGKKLEEKLEVKIDGVTRYFEAYRYYATKRDNTSFKKTSPNDSKTVGVNGATIDDILKGKARVRYGGIRVHVVYKEVAQEKVTNKYYCVDTDGNILMQGKLDDKQVGETLSWSFKKMLSYQNKTYKETNKYIDGAVNYDLIEAKVYKKGGKGELVYHKSLANGDTLKSIRESTVIVEKGGMALYLIYNKDGGGPDLTPTPTPPGGEDPRPITPVEAATESLPMNTPLTTGMIRADDRGAEKFVVTDAVPTTESLFAEVLSTEYLLGYTFEKKVGIQTFTIKVTKEYELIYTNAKGTKEITEIVPVEQNIVIQRAYGYWEITNLDYYKIGSATLYNYALPDGKVTLTPNSSYYKVPLLNYNHSTSIEDHVKYPKDASNGTYVLPKETLRGTGERPIVPTEDFTNKVDNLLGEAIVVNDYLTFDGKVVISNVEAEKEGLKPTISNIKQTEVLSNKSALYKNDLVIEATKLNGTYPSSGTITYVGVANVNTNYGSAFNQTVLGINDVSLHTPVYCKAVTSDNNKQYSQLINSTEDCVTVVLDPDYTLNDFTLTISNYGLHTYKQGYYTRDYSKNLRDPANTSYIQKANGLLRNEVRFPFDVYIKKSSGEDDFVEKNTWIVLGKSTVTFYVPMWVNEDVYTVECRTVAVNATESSLVRTEQSANTNRNNYVATDSFKVEVSGRIYGLNIYDISDYPIWEDIFRVDDSLDLKINDLTKYPLGIKSTTYDKTKSYNYSVGIKNQYGKVTGRDVQYTFPLVNGSHPEYKNMGILKKGYAVRFSLDTIGTMASDNTRVLLKPTFYFVDSKGGNRTAVDLYYSEDINGKSYNLVKVGSGLDQINLKKIRVGDPYLGIPYSELSATASLRNTPFYQWTTIKEIMFNFSDIRLNYAFRNFVNGDYANSIMSSAKNGSKLSAAGVTANDIATRKQRWYGEYYIPGTAMAVKQGFDVLDYADKYGVTGKEDFWLAEGYIIVNFDIVTVDKTGSEHLSYINADNYLNKGNCSMWVMEGAALSKVSYGDIKFNFKAGDMLIYYANKKVADDYKVGGIY